MTEAQTSIECAIGDTENLRRHLKELISKQVQSEDEKQIIKATAHAWFNNHRSTITNFVSDDATAALDDEYRTLLGGQLATSCVASTWTGLKILRTQLQADHVLAFSKTPAAVAPPCDRR